MPEGKRKKPEQIIIGRRETVNLPEFNLKNIKAKIDTGAYSGSIHCHHIKIQKTKGIRTLSFELLDPSHPKYAEKILKTRRFKFKSVKNSSGRSERRYSIESGVEIFGKIIDTEFTLSNRSEMKFPILLGRKFLKAGSFIVDISELNLSKKSKQKKKK